MRRSYYQRRARTGVRQGRTVIVKRVMDDPGKGFEYDRADDLDIAAFKKYSAAEPVKIWVRNLPKGLTNSGLKNLFLTVGNPLCISYSPATAKALVIFEHKHEAELAVRDLHDKAPYYLKVSLAHSRNANTERNNDPLKNEPWERPEDVTPIYREPVPRENPEEEEPTPEPVEKIIPNEEYFKRKEILTSFYKEKRRDIKFLSYDPSIRMRQKRLDFVTDVECISFGRGYTFMGSEDRCIDGIKNLTFSCQSGPDLPEILHSCDFYCERCEALTSKFCKRCDRPFCSNTCLTKARAMHKDCFSDSEEEDEEEKFPIDESSPTSSKKVFQVVKLEAGSTVIMTYYSTMRTVYVRGIEKDWDEKHARLANDVAGEALTAKRMEKPPKVNSIIAAKYSEDFCYYRAQVLSVNNDKATVFFIDYGNTQDTPLSNIRPIPENLQKIPALAVKIELKDVPETSSLESVNYYNMLASDSVPLILTYEPDKKNAVLTEKESRTVINEVVNTYITVSWKKDPFLLTKLSEVVYYDPHHRATLEIGKTCSIVITSIDKKEFLEYQTFWVLEVGTEEFYHYISEMKDKIQEYCDQLKDDCYLPRENELCLAYESGEWHRCVCLSTHRTTCLLFFIDDGHTRTLETDSIRKIIREFSEAPALAVCCTVPVTEEQKKNPIIQASVIHYLEYSSGSEIDSVKVLGCVKDAYSLSIPEINKILASPGVRVGRIATGVISSRAALGKEFQHRNKYNL